MNPLVSVVITTKNEEKNRLGREEGFGAFNGF